MSNADLKREIKEIEVGEKYIDSMMKVSKLMCERTKSVVDELEEKKIEIPEFLVNITKNSEEALNEGRFYSASSYCFNANIELRNKLYENLSDDDFNIVIESLDSLNLENLPSASPNNIQVYMIVQDRFEELKEMIKKAKAFKEKNQSAESNRLIAFAHERAFSITVWLKFFDESGTNGEFFDLRSSCIERLSEANERIQYAKIYFPKYIEDAEKILIRSKEFYEVGNYANCISNAVQAKSISNVLLTSIGVTDEQLPEIVKEKLKFASYEIASQDYFPILAYSYYEYAQSLLEDDPGSSLLYVEYALEMANLDNYLSRKKSDSVNEIIKNTFVKWADKDFQLIILGFINGLLIGSAIILFKRREKENKKKIKMKTESKIKNK